MGKNTKPRWSVSVENSEHGKTVLFRKDGITIDVGCLQADLPFVRELQPVFQNGVLELKHPDGKDGRLPESMFLKISMDELKRQLPLYAEFIETKGVRVLNFATFGGLIIHGNDSELLGHYTIENERLLIPLSKQFGSFYAPQSGGRLTEKLIVALHREHYSRYGHNLTILDEPLALEIAETMNSEVVYAVAKHLFDTTGVQVNILEIGPGPKPLKLDGVDPGIVAGYFGLDLDTANYVRLPGSGRVPESRIFYSDLSVMPVDGATLITGRGIGHFLSDEHAELVWRHLSSGGQPIVMIFPDHPWMARENPLVKKARKNGMTIESVARVPFKIICVGSQNLSEVIAPVADRAIDRMIDLERSFGDGKTSAVVP